jgi:hypothetical protein
MVRSAGSSRAGAGTLRTSVAILLGVVFLGVWRPAAAEVRLPQPSRSEPITVTAQAGTRWTQGAYEIWVLQGDCRLQQGSDTATSNEAVLWILRQDVTQRKPHTVLAYLEGNVAIDVRQDGARTRLTDQAWFGRFATVASIEVRPGQVLPPPQTPPAIFARATAQRDAAAGRVGPTTPIAAPPPSSNLPVRQLVPRPADEPVDRGD